MKEKIFYIIIISKLNIFLQVEWSGRVVVWTRCMTCCGLCAGTRGLSSVTTPPPTTWSWRGSRTSWRPTWPSPSAPAVWSPGPRRPSTCCRILTPSPLCRRSTVCHSRMRTAPGWDFSIVNRFHSHGGGWGYSGHSIEAVRFTVDTDILMGGFGLFGGCGEYVGKIKLFDIRADGGEGDGELLCESDEITYECGARQKYPIMVCVFYFLFQIKCYKI